MGSRPLRLMSLAALRDLKRRGVFNNIKNVIKKRLVEVPAGRQYSESL